MSANKLRRYQFASRKHWSSCLLAQVDRIPDTPDEFIQPAPPFDRAGTRYPSQGGFAPAATATGEIIWRDATGQILRRSPFHDEIDVRPAPIPIANATRLATTRQGIWAMSSAEQALNLYEADSLSRLLRVHLPADRLIDITTDGQDYLLALVRADNAWQVLYIDGLGRMVNTTNLAIDEHREPTELVHLQDARRFIAVVADRQPQLIWFSADDGQPIFMQAIAATRPCFHATTLGSDCRDRVFLLGRDGKEFGASPFVVSFDADGNRLPDLPLDLSNGAFTGIVGRRNRLFITCQRGLLQFDSAQTVPDDVSQIQCTVVTPCLFSPDREDQRRWLRIEATSILPAGCSIEIGHAATDDTAERDKVNVILGQSSVPASLRAKNVLAAVEDQSVKTVYQGSTDMPIRGHTFSAKLFNIRERYLWVWVRLKAAPGARLPTISRLDVLYPGQTLMEDLPGIYQKEEDRPNSFLRNLVGVLEANTQDIDARIRELGRHIHPETAPEVWLDFTARWLGIPWDDALSDKQKRALAMRAANLLSHRGTRKGLEILLTSLFPGSPHRFRITDANADYGFAIVGGGRCAGSALPAILGGNTLWHTELDSNTVLGYSRLPCPGHLEDGVGQFARTILIDVAATATERQKWEPWLPNLINEMVPLTTRAKIRWVSRHGLQRNRLDGTLSLESTSSPQLGTNTITGLTHLPLGSSQLSKTGPLIDVRLD